MGTLLTHDMRVMRQSAASFHFGSRQQLRTPRGGGGCFPVPDTMSLPLRPNVLGRPVLRTPVHGCPLGAAPGLRHAHPLGNESRRRVIPSRPPEACLHEAGCAPECQPPSVFAGDGPFRYPQDRTRQLLLQYWAVTGPRLCHSAPVSEVLAVAPGDRIPPMTALCSRRKGGRAIFQAVGDALGRLQNGWRAVGDRRTRLEQTDPHCQKGFASCSTSTGLRRVPTMGWSMFNALPIPCHTRPHNPFPQKGSSASPQKILLFFNILRHLVPTDMNPLTAHRKLVAEAKDPVCLFSGPAVAWCLWHQPRRVCAIEPPSAGPLCRTRRSLTNLWRTQVWMCSGVTGAPPGAMRGAGPAGPAMPCPAQTQRPARLFHSPSAPGRS